MLHSWETSNWRLVAFLFLCGSLFLSLSLCSLSHFPLPQPRSPLFASLGKDLIEKKKTYIQ